jgi:poly(beta-D-mannuronate) lyase
MLPVLAVQAETFQVSTVEAFAQALQKVKAGETIVWKNGTYTDLVIDFTPLVKGTAASRIYLKAETPGKVILKGASRLFIGGEYLQAEGFLFEGTTTLKDREDVIVFHRLKKADHLTRNSRLTNCALRNYTTAIDTVNIDWINLYGFDNEIDHCALEGKISLGPYLVVTYQKPANFVDGSDACPSSRHHIHHNYFGFRTMPGDNVGEDMRIGDSKTSFSRGFNIIEYNYFEHQQNEPEVISNKSCYNIYRFNTFYSNDGALVLRHGNRCLVYGNYINGKSGRGVSGGIRIVGTEHTVFNNYLENQEGGDDQFKAPMAIMGGIPNSAINGYFAADSAVVCFNTMVNTVGPVIRTGVKNHTDSPIMPQKLFFAQNYIIHPQGKQPLVLKDGEGVSYALCRDNLCEGGELPGRKGFTKAGAGALTEKNGLWYAAKPAAADLLALIRQRLQPFQLSLTNEEISVFSKDRILDKKDVGINW